MEADTPDVAEAASPPLEAHQLDFPPVRNGVDHLTKTAVGPRDIKYAVLHLRAAAEVLLKTRLVGEHRSLVFKDPGQASEPRFRTGDFESVRCHETALVPEVRLRSRPEEAR